MPTRRAIIHPLYVKKNREAQHAERDHDCPILLDQTICFQDGRQCGYADPAECLKYQLQAANGYHTRNNPTRPSKSASQ